MGRTQDGRAVRVASYRRAGRLTPKRGRGSVRAGSVRLRPGAVMDWHSTRLREELLILLAGRADLEVDRPAGRIRCVALRAGQCAWLAPRTAHRVVNRSTATAWYLYVTA